MLLLKADVSFILFHSNTCNGTERHITAWKKRDRISDTINLDHTEKIICKASLDNDQQRKKDTIHFVNVTHRSVFLPILDMVGGGMLTI